MEWLKNVKCSIVGHKYKYHYTSAVIPQTGNTISCVVYQCKNCRTQYHAIRNIEGSHVVSSKDYN